MKYPKVRALSLPVELHDSVSDYNIRISSYELLARAWAHSTRAVVV